MSMSEQRCDRCGGPCESDMTFYTSGPIITPQGIYTTWRTQITLAREQGVLVSVRCRWCEQSSRPPVDRAPFRFIDRRSFGGGER